MAKNTSMGLGLALARPDQGVWAIDGDGSLLMNLGSLVTIGALAPRNLLVVVYQNGTYDTTGGQPVPGMGQVDFCAIARGAGWPETVAFNSLDAMAAGLDAALHGDFPLLLTLQVAPAGRRPFPELTSTGKYIRRVWDHLARTPESAQPYAPGRA
jgi:phosphonopyruvate decarboxylase